MQKRKIYSGIFFPSENKHMTWHFKPNLATLPAGVKNGQSVSLRVVGEYKDNKCSCLIVKWGNIKYSPFNGSILHITLTYTGIKPFEVGVRATKNQDKIKYYQQAYFKKGVWGYYRA